MESETRSNTPTPYSEEAEKLKQKELRTQSYISLAERVLDHYYSYDEPSTDTTCPFIPMEVFQCGRDAVFQVSDDPDRTEILPVVCDFIQDHLDKTTRRIAQQLKASLCNDASFLLPFYLAAWNRLEQRTDKMHRALGKLDVVWLRSRFFDEVSSASNKRHPFHWNSFSSRGTYENLDFKPLVEDAWRAEFDSRFAPLHVLARRKWRLNVVETFGVDTIATAAIASQDVSKETAKEVLKSLFLAGVLPDQKPMLSLAESILSRPEEALSSAMSSLRLPQAPQAPSMEEAS